MNSENIWADISVLKQIYTQRTGRVLETPYQLAVFLMMHYKDITLDILMSVPGDTAVLMEKRIKELYDLYGQVAVDVPDSIDTSDNGA